MPELAIRAGHVPGAVNVPWAQAVAPDGTFKPVEELKKLYAAAGVDGTKPVIVYCRIGERSSHTWFALTKLLGYKVKNYDGVLMGFGALLAIGCTIGTLLSGIMAGALSGWVFAFFCVAGIVLGLRLNRLG